MSQNPQNYDDNGVGAAAGIFSKLGKKIGDYMAANAKSREDHFAEASGNARNDGSQSSWLNPEHVDAISRLLNESAGHDLNYMKTEQKQGRKNLKTAVKGANKVNAQVGTKQGFKTGPGGTVDMVHTRGSETAVSAESPAVPAKPTTTRKPRVVKPVVESAAPKAAPKRAPKAGK